MTQYRPWPAGSVAEKPWTGWLSNGTGTPLIGAVPSSVPDGGRGGRVRAGRTARASSIAWPGAGGAWSRAWAAAGAASASAAAAARNGERRMGGGGLRRRGERRLEFSPVAAGEGVNE